MKKRECRTGLLARMAPRCFYVLRGSLVVLRRGGWTVGVGPVQQRRRLSIPAQLVFYGLAVVR